MFCNYFVQAVICDVRSARWCNVLLETVKDDFLLLDCLRYICLLPSRSRSRWAYLYSLLDVGLPQCFSLFSGRGSIHLLNTSDISWDIIMPSSVRSTCASFSVPGYSLCRSFGPAVISDANYVACSLPFWACDPPYYIDYFNWLAYPRICFSLNLSPNICLSCAC